MRRVQTGGLAVIVRDPIADLLLECAAACARYRQVEAVDVVALDPLDPASGPRTARLLLTPWSPIGMIDEPSLVESPSDGLEEQSLQALLRRLDPVAAGFPDDLRTSAWDLPAPG